MALTKKTKKRLKKGAISAAVIAAAIAAAAAAHHYSKRGHNPSMPKPVAHPGHTVKPIKAPGETDHGPITLPRTNKEYPYKPGSGMKKMSKG